MVRELSSLLRRELNGKPEIAVPYLAVGSRQTTTQWCLEVVLRSRGLGCNPASKVLRAASDFPAGAQSFLNAHGVNADPVEYGEDFGGFLEDLASYHGSDEDILGLIAMPSRADCEMVIGKQTISRDTGLFFRRSGTWSFIFHDQHYQHLIEYSLCEMRAMHLLWSSWPHILPSMLLSVLWVR